MKDRIFAATFSENAVSVIRRHGIGIELNDLCISENLAAESWYLQNGGAYRLHSSDLLSAVAAGKVSGILEGLSEG